MAKQEKYIQVGVTAMRDPATGEFFGGRDGIFLHPGAKGSRLPADAVRGQRAERGAYAIGRVAALRGAAHHAAKRQRRHILKRRRERQRRRRGRQQQKEQPDQG